MIFKSDKYTRLGYEKRFKILTNLFYAALISLPFLGLGFWLFNVEDKIGVIFRIIGLVLFIPWFIYAYVLCILHWKERYVGNHSTLWGILLLVETSGWFKIIYLLRHILADIRSSGRYKEINALEQDGDLNG